MSFIQKYKNSPVFWQSLANYTDRVWALIFSIILARIVAPESFGLLAFGISIAFLSVFICRWEIVSLVRSDPYYRAEGFNTIWRLTGGLVLAEILVIVLVSFIVYLIGESSQLSLIILIYGVFAALDRFALVLKCDLEGELKFRPNFYTRILIPPITALVVLPMALLGCEVWALLTASCLNVVVNWLVYRKANPRKLSFIAEESEELMKLIKSSFWLWLDQLSSALVTRGDKVLLGLEIDDKNLAAYNRSYNFSPISLMLLGGLVGSPAIVAIARSVDDKAQFKIFFKRATFIILAGLINGFIWFFFSEEIIGVVFGANWLYAAPVFKMLAFFGAVNGLYLISLALLAGRKEFKALACLKLIGLVVLAIGVSFMGINIYSIAYGFQLIMLLISLFIIAYFFYTTQFFKKCKD